MRERGMRMRQVLPIVVLLGALNLLATAQQQSVAAVRSGVDQAVASPDDVPYGRCGAGASGERHIQPRHNSGRIDYLRL